MRREHCANSGPEELKVYHEMRQFRTVTAEAMVQNSGVLMGHGTSYHFTSRFGLACIRTSRYE